MLLYQNGQFLQANMSKANITKQDILKELGFECQSNSLEPIAEVYIERTGKISFVKKMIYTICTSLQMHFLKGY
jgi:uncharacterized membrane protein YcaP (DUF421 family)